jgi:hypothetical protein
VIGDLDLPGEGFAGIITRMRADPTPATSTHQPRLRLAADTAHAGTIGTLAEIEQVLAEARRTLGRLRSDRVMLEQRLAASGRVDPIREIRGRSALDESIDRTVAMIRRLEQVLESRPPVA